MSTAPAFAQAATPQEQETIVLKAAYLFDAVDGRLRPGATIVGAMVMGLDRAAAAEFSFFLAMPTMVAAFGYELLDVRDQLDPGRVLEIGIGFVTAFVAALVVVRPFLRFVGRSGFAPFAWYRIAMGVAILVALRTGWLG